MTCINNPIDIPASERSNDYDFDNLLGRELASRLVGEVRENGSPVALAFAIRSMVEAGRWSGVEIGFAFGLAIAALQPAQVGAISK